MTIKELSQLYYLNREIEADTRRLKEIQGKAYTLGSPALTGMPHSNNNESKVERYAAEIADLIGIIDAKRLQCLHERNRLERYISTIPDSLTRQIFQYRFVDGLPWQQVAACIGDGYTAEAVRQTCSRYIRNNKHGK